MARAINGLASAARALANGERFTPEMNAAIARAQRELAGVVRRKFHSLREVVEDIVAEAMTELVKSANTIRATTDAKVFAWLRRVVINRGLDEVKRRRREQARDRRLAPPPPPRASASQNPTRGDRRPASLPQDDWLALEAILARIRLHASKQQRPSIDVAIRVRRAGDVRALLPPGASRKEINRMEQQASRGRRRAREIAAALDPPLDAEEMALVEAFFPVRDG